MKTNNFFNDNYFERSTESMKNVSLKNPVENIHLDFHVDNPHGNTHGYPRYEHTFPHGYPYGFYVINPRGNRGNTFRFANVAIMLL